MLRRKIFFNWSTGKDSAFALYELLQKSDDAVELLLTTLSAVHERVTMHGLRVELLKRQAQAVGLPWDVVKLPENPSNAVYESLMREKMLQLKNQGFTHAAFGDIFLQDLRTYRQKMLQKVGMRAIFPIWRRNSAQLIRQMIEAGFQAIVICAHAQLLGKEFVGRIIDDDFIHDLPKNIDPCGENGEFHTFCFNAPFFKQPVRFVVGETVYRQYGDSPQSGFWFCDLLPDES